MLRTAGRASGAAPYAIISRLCEMFHMLEPTSGLEPADPVLTKNVLYLLSYVGSVCNGGWGPVPRPVTSLMPAGSYLVAGAGFEPA